MKTRLKLVVVWAILCFPSLLTAAEHYVRAGASGAANGSDWANAWTALPTTLTRGDTYYVADGTYGGYDFDTAASGTTFIYVRKATPSDHGTETGWNSGYGDGQAEFATAGSVLTFSTAYWVFDGQVGSGQSGQGFKVTVTGTADATRGIRVLAGHLTISHVEVTSVNPAGVADAAKQDGIYTTSAAATDVTISDCYIHNWKRCAILVSGTTRWTIERNFVYHTYSTSGAHGQAIQLGPSAVSDLDIRYNTFKDTHGTGVIVYLDNSFNDLRIYGNLFWHTGEPAAIGINSTSQAIGSTAGDTATNIKIHNNTFVGMKGRAPQPSGGIDHNGVSTGNVTYNNLWYDCVVTFNGTSHDYNWYYLSGTQSEPHIQQGSGNPFVNHTAGVFKLASAISAGVPLSPPFDKDKDGKTRGSDGVWDRGAFEFEGASVPLRPPTGVIIVPEQPQ